MNLNGINEVYTDRWTDGQTAFQPYYIRKTLGQQLVLLKLKIGIG